MSKKITISLAEKTDGVAILHILKKMFEESLYKGDAPLSDAKVASYIASALEYGVIFCAWDAKKGLVGVLALEKGAYFFSEKECLDDKFFYVDSDNRHGKTAGKLIDKAKSTAEEMGLPLVMSHSHSYERQDAKDKLFEKNGFGKIGSTFRYDPPPAGAA